MSNVPQQTAAPASTIRLSKTHRHWCVRRWAAIASIVVATPPAFSAVAFGADRYEATTRRLQTHRLALTAAAFSAIGAPQAPTSSASKATTMLLVDAITQGLVSAVFAGTGSSSGDVIHVTVTRRQAGAPLRLVVPAGSLLRSTRATVQDMVVLGVRGRLSGRDGYFEESDILVNSDQPVTYVLNAACIDFEEENPSEADRFTLEAPADATLSCIAREGARLSEIPAVQAAVWMHTDGVTFESINETFDVTKAEWTMATQIRARCLPQEAARPPASPQTRETGAVQAPAPVAEGPAGETLARPGALLTVIANAPIFLFPDDRREPLLTAAAGSTVTVVTAQPSWYRVEFSDSRWPSRFGYIASRHVQPVPPTSVAVSAPVRSTPTPAPTETPAAARTVSRQRAATPQGALRGATVAGRPASVPAPDPGFIPVLVIGRRDNSTEYSYQLPGRWNTSSGTNVSCFSLGGVNCYGSSSASGTVTPAREVSYVVRGASLSLELPDGRVVVVNCDRKPAIGRYRSCRVPLVDAIRVEFDRDNAKLSWSVSVDGSRFQSETYKILAVLEREQ